MLTEDQVIELYETNKSLTKKLSEADLNGMEAFKIYYMTLGGCIILEQVLQK